MLENFELTPNIEDNGIMFADLQKDYRSGHMTHALIEYDKDCMLAFYSNCSGRIEKGHTGYGWIEYKRTTNGGKTWSDPIILPYGWQSFIDGCFNISVEKGVCTDDGVIVLFCLRNKKITRWEPYLEPVILRSFDNGETWEEPVLMCNERGRVMDILYKDGVIYALEFCNDAEIKWTGNLPEHVYKLYVSEDSGATFKERSVLPYDTKDKSYGAMEWAPDGSLMTYIYNEKDEFNMVGLKSADGGFTWGDTFESYCKKRIRNPQICCFEGTYFLHGRSGSLYLEGYPYHFVLYTSEDGVNWDDGEYIRISGKDEWGDCAYYSNNLVTGRFGGEKRLLIQASDPYFEGRVNVKHWWIDKK